MGDIVLPAKIKRFGNNDGNTVISGDDDDGDTIPKSSPETKADVSLAQTNQEVDDQKLVKKSVGSIYSKQNRDIDNNGLSDGFESVDGVVFESFLEERATGPTVTKQEEAAHEALGELKAEDEKREGTHVEDGETVYQAFNPAIFKVRFFGGVG